MWHWALCLRIHRANPGNWDEKLKYLRNLREIQSCFGDAHLQASISTIVMRTIDTGTKAKRNNMISELMTFRVTKAKAKLDFGVKYLCEYEYERASVPIYIDTKAKAKAYLEGLIITFICVATSCIIKNLMVSLKFGGGGIQQF